MTKDQNQTRPLELTSEDHDTANQMAIAEAKKVQRANVGILQHNPVGQAHALHLVLAFAYLAGVMHGTGIQSGQLAGSHNPIKAAEDLLVDLYRKGRDQRLDANQ